MNNRHWPAGFSLLLFVAACSQDEVAAANPPSNSAAEGSHETSTHVPSRLTSVDLGRDAVSGSEQRVRCETCHSMRASAPLPSAMTDLREFHVGLSFAHGDLSCSACHAEGQPPQLKLASGERIPPVRALLLCAQCHGPQYRDYQHGAHGGMSGYWDLSAGPRTRNHCVDCHDPHTPRIVPVMPKPPPRDRFLNPTDPRGATH